MADLPACCFFRPRANEKTPQTIGLILGGGIVRINAEEFLQVDVTEQVRSPKGPRRVLSPLHFINKKPDCEGCKYPSATRLSLPAQETRHRGLHQPA